MKIACLGWGSLVWKPGDLPVESDWHCDGPKLPIEYSRQSSDNRITLAVTPGVAPVHVLWARLKGRDLVEAKAALADREGILPKNRDVHVGVWSVERTEDVPGALEVDAWARLKGLDAVVWTTLPPKFGGEAKRIPNEHEVTRHLKELTASQKTAAEEYVRCTPKQIRTSYRRAIENELGWCPLSEAYTSDVRDIIDNAEKYHAAYNAAETFGGPSLHFHRRALELRNSQDFERYLEYIYATLPAWGMHRMGPGGSKMLPFEQFLRSVEPLQDALGQATGLAWHDLTHENWSLVERLFREIRIMASKTTLVGNAKVLAHMLPDVVPPIDRRYTLKRLKKGTSIRNNVDGEWLLMKEIISDFFVPVVADPAFRAQADAWVSDQNRFPWDTSLMKVVDNLVIGAGKIQSAGKRRTRSGARRNQV